MLMRGLSSILLQANVVNEELGEEGDLESSPSPSPRKALIGCNPLLHAKRASPSRRVLKGPAAAGKCLKRRATSRGRGFNGMHVSVLSVWDMGRRVAWL
jgi:hypothetical protein